VEIRDIARGPDGSIWLAMADHVLRRISTRTGEELQVVGTPGSTGHVAGSGSAARFNIITQIESGFVVDFNGIRPFSSSSGAVELASHTPIAGISDVRSLDPALWGHSYISVHSGNHRVSTFTTNPGTKTDLGTGASGLTNGLAHQARFFGPLGVSVAGSRAWISDSQNRALRMVHLIGDHGANRSYYVTTIAGGNGAGAVDGPGTSAQFGSIGRIEVDQSSSRPRDEDIYVVDTTNHTIRRVLRLGRLSDVPTALETVSDQPIGFPGAIYLPHPNGALNPSWLLGGEDELEFPMILPEGTDTLVADVYLAGVPELSTSLSGVVNSAGTDVAGSPHVSVVTIAGRQGSGGYSDGPGSVAAFGSQLGLAMDASLNLYVADSDSGTIRWRNFGAGFHTILGTPFLSPGPAVDGNGLSRAGTPHDVAVSADGRTLWYTDSVHHVIRRATHDPSLGAINNPASWTTVTLYGSAGTPGDALGSGAVARLNQPRGIAIDAAGSVLYVADRGNNKIKRFSAFGGPIALLAGSGAAGASNAVGALATFSQPEDVAVGLAGDIFVADFGNRLIRRVTQGGAASTLAGAAGITGMVDSATGGGARFTQPSSLAADSNGFLFVADKRVSWVIRRISPSGQTATVAGVSSQSALADGPGNASCFGTGSSLVLTSTPRGELMASAGNTIREIHHFISSASP
jgi:sugar lactone lactonase YvrE